MHSWLREAVTDWVLTRSVILIKIFGWPIFCGIKFSSNMIKHLSSHTFGLPQLNYLTDLFCLYLFLIFTKVLSFTSPAPVPSTGPSNPGQTMVMQPPVMAANAFQLQSLSAALPPHQHLPQSNQPQPSQHELIFFDWCDLIRLQLSPY